ncbi:MAG: hypothetical protein Q8Q59_11630 [Luteolibacter sp.]|nr:hypothetical protein [Luteolibacter sp.]
MKLLAVFVGSLCAASSVRAETLSSADREALLEKLTALRENADSTVDKRYRMAMAAYNAAAGSDEAAMEFHLKCIEKVNFEDQQKKNSDFREWKRKEAPKLSAPGLGMALRLQLRWLILTLRATSEKADRDVLASSAREIVDAISQDAEKLKDHQQLLNQPVTGSVFAGAYDIGEVKVEKWPLAPAQIGQIYEQILLPPLRAPSRLESLRSAWIRRIQQEMAIREFWTGGAGGGGEPASKRIGMASAMRSPEYERFIIEAVPALQWQMEMDLFKNGDQRGAALRMLSHLEKHINHKSVRDWGTEFAKLLNPEKKLPETPAAAE